MLEENDSLSIDTLRMSSCRVTTYQPSTSLKNTGPPSACAAAGSSAYRGPNGSNWLETGQPRGAAGATAVSCSGIALPPVPMPLPIEIPVERTPGCSYGQSHSPGGLSQLRSV